MIAGRRAFVIVLDACGAGALPDADEYGDAGTNTLRHVGEAEGGLDVPALARLGLGNVTEIPGVAPVADPAVHGRLAPLGHGKDTTTGHWELMGVAAPRAPVYPEGFPRRGGRGVHRGDRPRRSVQRAARGASRARGVRAASTWRRAR